jgi:hypothetical protein
MAQRKAMWNPLDSVGSNSRCSHKSPMQPYH